MRTFKMDVHTTQGVVRASCTFERKICGKTVLILETALRKILTDNGYITIKATKQRVIEDDEDGGVVVSYHGTFAYQKSYV